MKTSAAVLFLGLLSLGHSAALPSCDSLLKPITITYEDMLGKWHYIAGSSDIPGSRSLAHLMNSVWLNITATSQSNTLTLLQTQKIYGKCSSLIYNVTFENSEMLIEQPFYLREAYLSTGCSDCLLAYEEIVSGVDKFKSLLLFSKSNSVPAAEIETLKARALCLQMPSPLLVDSNEEICPDGIPPSEGLSALNKLLEAKMGHQFARFLDAFFDWFVN